MHCLNIAVAGNDEEFISYISNRLEKISNGELKYKIDSRNSTDSTSVVCSVDTDRGKRDGKGNGKYGVLSANVAVILADYIVKKYEWKLVNRIINTNYCYFNAGEKRDILEAVACILNNEDKTFINSLFKIRRRNTIVKKLVEYFRTSNRIILEGFVNFRMKEYVKDLEEVVDKAVDNFLMEREYREFIRLLRYFVDIQEPKFSVIHVNPTCDGKYLLLDESRKEISGRCIQELLDEVSEGEISYDDLLVSSLITLAPKKIVIHRVDSFKNRELLETIKNVFAGRVRTCNGCSLCIVCLAGNRGEK